MKKAICLLISVFLIGVLVGVFILPLLESDKRMSEQEIEAIQILYYTHGFNDGKLQKDGVRLVDTMPLTSDRMQAILDSEIATTYPRYSNPKIGGSK